MFSWFAFDNTKILMCLFLALFAIKNGRISENWWSSESNSKTFFLKISFNRFSLHLPQFCSFWMLFFKEKIKNTFSFKKGIHFKLWIFLAENLQYIKTNTNYNLDTVFIFYRANKFISRVVFLEKFLIKYRILGEK